MSKSKFICLEEIEGRKLLINTEQINAVAQEKNGCTIYFDGGDYFCMKSSFDDVVKAIERSGE